MARVSADLSFNGCCFLSHGFMNISGFSKVDAHRFAESECIFRLAYRGDIPVSYAFLPGGCLGKAPQSNRGLMG